MQTVRSQLFEGITNEECARMFQCFGAREAGYEAGALISEFDGEQNAVGVLLSGSADLVRLDADGNRTILETLEEGGVFGEVLAFSGAGGDSIFLECRRDCRVLYLDYDQITKRCENACLHSGAEPVPPALDQDAAPERAGGGALAPLHPRKAAVLL